MEIVSLLFNIRQPITDHIILQNVKELGEAAACLMFQQQIHPKHEVAVWSGRLGDSALSRLT